jgi:hypothetical protein
MKNPKTEARALLADYRRRIAKGSAVSASLVQRARRAYLHFGGDPEPADFSLGNYDHENHGPFLGVSDEGSAAIAIRDAAHASPKCRALSTKTKLTPEIVGVALDAERLGGIGEIAVGPEEYAEGWAATVDRLLLTTNVGTRVNLRLYRREPRVAIHGDSPAALRRAQAAIAAAFALFVRTPDSRPRPLTVFLEVPTRTSLTRPRRVALLSALAGYVASGQAAGLPVCPPGHRLGLAIRVGWGLAGRDAALDAIDLAASAGLDVVIIDGVKRKAADSAISLAGLLDYFPPGLVGPILRRAKEKFITLRAANLADTDTVARSVWSSLHTARAMGAHLGKYGCFPLSLDETAHVVAEVQRWFSNWTAAPALFLDQGVLRAGAIDVGSDLPRGIEAWLTTVAAAGVRVVLLDTIDKSSGRRLLKKDPRDPGGYLGWRQIERIERHAAALGLRVLWAGGLGPRDAYEMGRRGVFGIYVTSAVATAVAATGDYERDPMLPSVKEPTRDAVLRVKTLLEAGFLATKLDSAEIAAAAEGLLRAIEAGDEGMVATAEAALFQVCTTGWRQHWARG